MSPVRGVTDVSGTNTILAQPDPDSVREQHGRVIGQLERRSAKAAAMLRRGGPPFVAPGRHSFD
jgi:hypothetical protein